MKRNFGLFTNRRLRTARPLVKQWTLLQNIQAMVTKRFPLWSHWCPCQKASRLTGECVPHVTGVRQSHGAWELEATRGQGYSVRRQGVQIPTPADPDVSVCWWEITREQDCMSWQVSAQDGCQPGASQINNDGGICIQPKCRWWMAEGLKTHCTHTSCPLKTSETQ